MQSAETTSPSSSRELPPGIRIALGAIARSQGGPRTYALELLDALTTRYPEACWSLITEDRTPFTVRDTIVKGCRFDELPMAHPALRPLWERRALPRGIAAGRAQLYHGTKNTVPAGLAIPSVVTVHDLHATILHCLGIDHKRLTVRFQGRDFRLTDVHGNVVHKILG